jgi:hypothetical protein
MIRHKSETKHATLQSERPFRTLSRHYRTLSCRVFWHLHTHTHWRSPVYGSPIYDGTNSRRTIKQQKLASHPSTRRTQPYNSLLVVYGVTWRGAFRARLATKPLNTANTVKTRWLCKVVLRNKEHTSARDRNTVSLCFVVRIYSTREIFPNISQSTEVLIISTTASD